MGRESLAGKAASPGNTLMPAGTGLKDELASLASRRVASTGESPDLGGSIRKLLDRVSAVARFGTASLERDPGVHRRDVTVLVERKATLAHQPKRMAFMPFDRLQRHINGHERLPPGDFPFFACEGRMGLQQKE